MLEAYSRRDARHATSKMNQLAVMLILGVSLLVGLSWTVEAWGQAKFARVGILSFARVTNDPNVDVVLKVFRQTLANQGWIEGKNVLFEYQSANSDPSRFAAAASRLVEHDVDVILATSAPALRAAYAATRNIPIVAGDFTTDPIAEGYIESNARPGGNVTGIFLDAPEFSGKWLELLKEIIPDLSRVAVLWDPGPGTTHVQAVRSVAKLLEIKLQVIQVAKPDDIDTAFSAFRGRPQAVILLPSPMIYSQSARLAGLALKHGLPATSMAQEFAHAGGTLAYGPERASVFERSAVFVARILSGSNPAELPVERPAKIQLVVNLKTAKALGITIPRSILLRADEVIQ